MPRSEVYDAKTRKGSLKGNSSSIYFTLPTTKKSRTKSTPERRVFMLRYFNKDEREVRLYCDKTILLYHGYYQLIRGGVYYPQAHEYLGFYEPEELGKEQGFNCLQSETELERCRSKLKVRHPARL
jgi:hypothetical protein